MKNLVVIILSTWFGISSVVHAVYEVTTNCADALHDYYLITLLVKPNNRSLGEKTQSEIDDRIHDLWLKMKSECPSSLSNQLERKFENFSIAKNEYLNNLKMDIGVNIPLVGEPIPLHQPNLDDIEVAVWASKVLMETYLVKPKTFDNFLSISDYYTEAAYEQIINDIMVGYMKGVMTVKGDDITFKDKTFELTSTIAAIPKITYKNPNKQNIYTWRLKVPLLLSIRFSDRIKKEKLMISLHIMRVPYTDSKEGLAISSFELIY